MLYYASFEGTEHKMDTTNTNAINAIISNKRAEDISRQSTQGQNNAGYCEDNNNDYNEARDNEFESYVAEVEEALAAEEEAYEAFLAKEEEERSENEDEPLTDEEYEYYMSFVIKYFADDDDPYGLEAA